MLTELQKWPYDFPASSEFPPSDQRGNVSGRIQVRDRYLTKSTFSLYFSAVCPNHIKLNCLLLLASSC